MNKVSHVAVVDFIVSQCGGRDEDVAAVVDVNRCNIPKWRKSGVPTRHHYAYVQQVKGLTYEMLSLKEPLPPLDGNS